MVQGARRKSARWGSAPRAGALAVVVGAALLGALLAGCGGPGPGSASGRIRIRSAPTAVTGTDASATLSGRPVISAWIAAQLAFENAVRTADATAPELAATSVVPQLAWAESFLTLVRAAGEVATGPVAFGDPQVVSQGPDLATVRACVHDGEVVISAATGRPVAGVLGQVDYELFTSVMERTASGWKLANQSVEVGQCRGS
jgi:hypothetical protein